MRTPAEEITTTHLPVPAGWARVGFWVCVVIGIAVVIRRMIALAIPVRSGPPKLAALDAYFVAHAHLTLVHILCALAFVLITPWVILWPGRSVWPERLLYPLGVAVAITAYAMSIHAVGGWLERSAVLVFNTVFLFALARAATYRGQGLQIRKQEWLLRAIIILLGIATTRPVMGIFFATSRLTLLEPQEFFGIAFWIGFSINTLAVEWWLRTWRAGRANVTA